MQNFRLHDPQMSADPSAEVARAAMTLAFALGAARAMKVDGLALAGAALLAARPVRPDLMDGVQPGVWGSTREVEAALLCSRGGPDYVRCEIITMDDSPYLGWEDSWTE